MVKEDSGHIYAAIDLGSNSFHMLVVRLVSGSVQIIGKVKRKVRLASGLCENNYLDEDSIQRGLDCLALFADRLRDIPRKNIRIVGTATLRLAKNVDEFLARAQKILDHEIEIISGKEEAKTIYLGVAHTSGDSGLRLVIDIGGASTEMIVGEGFDAKLLNSLNMGCVTFLEKYFPNNVINEDHFADAVAAANDVLQPYCSEYKGWHWETCVGASGTPQAVQESLIAQGYNELITLDRLYMLRDQAIVCGSVDALDIKGLTVDRKHVFTSGLAILIALFESLDIRTMSLAGGALREGVVYELMENMRHEDIRQRSVVSLMERYNVDAEHAESVAAVAKRCLDQLSEHALLNEFDAKSILLAACRLHEIGLQIEFKKAHEHAAYILSYTNVPGFSQSQKNLLVALVANHRLDINVQSIENQTMTSVPLAALLVRLLRISVILCMIRKNEEQPAFKLELVGEELTLTMPKGFLRNHPLINAELAHERWLQHKAGWKLEFC